MKTQFNQENKRQMYQWKYFSKLQQNKNWLCIHAQKQSVANAEVVSGGGNLILTPRVAKQEITGGR